MFERCVRCGAPAGIKMTFNYDAAMVWLDDLDEPVAVGEGYPMCEDHSGRLTPPVGWTLVDRRHDVRPLFASLDVA